MLKLYNYKKPASTLDFKVGEGLTPEQTNIANQKIAEPDYAMESAQANSPWGIFKNTISDIGSKIKNEFSIRTEPVEVRRMFEAEPIKTTAPPIVTQLGSLGFSLVEAIPKMAATVYGELFAPDRKTGNVNIGISAKRLGYDQSTYPTAAKQVQDEITNGTPPAIAALKVFSEKTLDVAFGAQLTTQVLKTIETNLLKSGVEAKIGAWETLGRPATIEEAQTNKVAQTGQALENSRNLAVAERERIVAKVNNTLNKAVKTLTEKGIPTATDTAKLRIAKVAEVASRETPITKDISGEILKPDIKFKTTPITPPVVAGALPGTREVPGQAPAFGLSTKEVENVGYGAEKNISNEIIKPIAPVEEKMSMTKAVLENIREQLAEHPARPLLKFVDKRTGQFEDFKNPDLAKTEYERQRIVTKNKKIIETAMNAFDSNPRYSDLFDNPDTIQEVIADYKNTRQVEKSLIATRNELQVAIRENKSQEILDRISQTMAQEQEKLIEFSKKYPRLASLISPMSKEAEIGAKKGYRLGLTEGAKQTRDTLIASLREKVLSIDNIKKQMVDHIKNNIPAFSQGIFLNMVKDAKTQRDLVKAFFRIDRKSEELAFNRAIFELKNIAGKLSEKSSVAVDYRNKIKDILDEYELSGHSKFTLEKLKATQDFIDKAKAEGKDVELPQRIIDKLKILSRTSKEQLTLSQVEGLRNEIELLGKLGETKWKTKEALYEREKELRKKALMDTATPINKISLPERAIGDKTNKWVQRYIKARNYFQKTNIALTPIDGLADITGMHPMKAALDLNFGNYLTYNDKAIKGWYELTKDFSEKEFERIGAYAMSRQTGGLERLANSGITKEQIDAIILTPEEEKAYQYVRDEFEKEFPNVKKYAQDVYNADVGQVDNYVSFMSDYDAMSDLEIYDRFGQRGEEISNLKTKTVEQGFTKERAGLSNIKLELDINKIFRRHIDDVAYMLTSGRDIKMYSEIINSPEMRQKLGEVGTMAWKQWLDLMARKGGTEGAKRIAALDVIRKNIGAGVLAFRLSSALVQFSSFADTIATIGAEYATKGASDIATSREWRNFVMDNFPEVKKAVGDDIAFREFGEGMLDKMARIGLTPLQTLDGIMRSTAIAAAYEKLAFEKGIKIDLKNPDKKLVQEATKLMRNSQGSSFFKDQPLAITSGYGLAENKSINKTLLTFQSFMLNRWDNIKRQIWRLGIKEKDYAKAGMSFFWLIIVASAMEEGIRRGGRALINLATGDKQEESSFAGNAALNVIQNVPIVGSLVSSMTYSSNPVPIINTFEETIGGVGSAINNKTLSSKAKGAVTALGGIGSLSGVPGSSQASQIIKKAIPTPESEKAKAQEPIKKIYDQVQTLMKDGQTTEARQLVENLTNNEYEIYKDIKTAEKSKATAQGKKDMLPLYEKIQKLKEEGNVIEAQALVNNFTDDEYRYYKLIKEAKAQEAVYK